MRSRLPSLVIYWLFLFLEYYLALIEAARAVRCFVTVHCHTGDSHRISNFLWQIWNIFCWWTYFVMHSLRSHCIMLYHWVIFNPDRETCFLQQVNLSSASLQSIFSCRTVFAEICKIVLGKQFLQFLPICLVFHQKTGQNWFWTRFELIDLVANHFDQLTAVENQFDPEENIE